MATIHLTTKRQATLPKQVCEDLGVHPGDSLLIERRVVDGETLWVLRPLTVDWSWIGSVSVRKRVSHDMDAIRASVARGRARDYK